MNERLLPDRILQLGFGFWGSKALLSAVELGLFTGSPGRRLMPVRWHSASACTPLCPRFFRCLGRAQYAGPGRRPLSQ